MKKFYAKNFAYGAAALLVGAVGLTGCSSDDELTNVNPTYDGESVKAQFAINIPYGGGKGTRVSQAIVQGQNPPTFRGMTNIRLVPFTGTISGTTTTSIQPIALGAIGSSDLQTKGNYKVYNDVDIPVGVNNFLFYGEATDQTDDTSDKTNGALIPSYEVGGWPLDQTVDNITFSLKPILGTGSVESSQKTLAQMLTDIAGVSGTNNTKWSEVANGDLKTYYTNFTSLKAGSANSIKAALQELYNSVKSKDVTDVDGLKAAIAQAIIATYFDATPQSDGTYTLEWKSSIDPAVKTFPNNLGLPDGSQQLTFNAGEKKFNYAIPSTTVSAGNILQQTAYDKYVYPASLFYTVNTPIKVADQTMTNGGVYNGTFSNWNEILGLQGFKDGTVGASTQSIALVNPIQYAVANLNLFVRFADTYIYDNGDNWPSGAAVGQIAVPIPNAGFKLTGVLVGGQKPVKWDFTTTDTQDNAAWTIYDASMGSAVVKKASDYETTPTAYTLALETKGVSAGAGEGEKVRIALEMTNDSGADFVGADGIVPAGGKFYLVGELVSSTAVGTDGDGSSLKVFEQDHKTIARVTINSLKSAYNCIPDLRSPKLELGLSVDLTWQQGLVYDVTIQ